MSLEVRTGETGAPEYWAYTDVSHFSVYALAQVLQLVDRAGVPHSQTYVEDSDAVKVNPALELRVKQDNQWDIKYPRVRVKSVNVTITEGFEPGKDFLSMEEVPGLRSTFHKEEGVLTIAAVPGFDFTDSMDEDYGDAAVELVDVSEVLMSAGASAALQEFSKALRLVAFETSTSGSVDRVMELSVEELMTSDVVAKISWTRVVNSPDPPEVLLPPFPLIYFEKAPLTGVAPSAKVRAVRMFCARAAQRDRERQRELLCSVSWQLRINALPCARRLVLQVAHPDFKMIQAGAVWLEPMADNDVLLYDNPGFAAPKAMSIKLDPATRRWGVSGLADPAIYTSVFQVSHFFRAPLALCVCVPLCCVPRVLIPLRRPPCSSSVLPVCSSPCAGLLFQERWPGRARGRQPQPHGVLSGRGRVWEEGKRRPLSSLCFGEVYQGQRGQEGGEVRLSRLFPCPAGNVVQARCYPACQ